MQIAINVNDNTIATQILQFLERFNQNIEIKTDVSSNTYLTSQQFKDDKNELDQVLKSIKSSASSTTPIDSKFWDDMERVIESA